MAERALIVEELTRPARRLQEYYVALLRNCLQVPVLATSNAHLPPPAGPREDLTAAATTPLLFIGALLLGPSLLRSPSRVGA
jgi:hypothetical protein